jgi:hypothetical protein
MRGPLGTASFAAAFLVATCALGGDVYETTEVKGEHYVAGAKYRGSVRTSTTARARLWVVATDGWHMNDKFPYEVKVSASEDVSLPETVFDKDDAVTFNEHKIVFKIPYVLEEAGSHDIEAEIKLAVCTEDQCVPHTAELTWTVSGSEDAGGG